ncbi:hypothetical protein BDZ94DRAFT_1298071, partial [Collybia nuda]
MPLSSAASSSSVVGLWSRANIPNVNATGVVCNIGLGFAWADNSRHISPCILLENLLSASSNGTASNWKLNSLSTGMYYTPPTSEKTLINTCACTWVAYNLISACTACQGYNDSIQSWPVYSAQCDVVTDIVLPTQRLPDSQDVAIPFWAATNPTQWYYQQFNISQAKAIAAQGREDLLPSGHGRDSPVVAIVGIVCGLGFAVLFGIGLYLFALIRQKDFCPKSTVSMILN